MFGPRIGIRIGQQIGVTIGGGGVAADPMSGVTRDATSGIYRPQTAAEWDIALAAAGITSGGPSFAWDCQGAAGNLSVLFGNAGNAGVKTGTIGYQQAVTGWTAQCVKTTDNTIGMFQINGGTLPDIGAVSCLVMSTQLFPASSVSDRTIMQLGSGFVTRVGVDTDGANKIVAVASPNSTAGAAAPWGAVHPLDVLVNRTAGATIIATDQEALTPALAANPTGAELIWGGDFSDTWNPGAQGLIDLAVFVGAAAELSSAQLKTLRQTLGYTVAW